MKKILLTLLAASLTLGHLRAQDDNEAINDAGLWTTFNLSKELHQKFYVFFTQEFRMRDNISRINLFYSELGVEYRPVKVLRIAFSYRHIDKFMIDNTFSYRHRLMLDLTYKKKFGDISFAYRHRLQREVRDIYTSEIGMMPEWYSRNKITLKYDSDSKYKPYLAAEYRYQIVNPREVEVDGQWHRQRYVAGLDYEINKRSTFGLYYLYQGEWNASQPENLYVIGLEYSISL